MNGIETLHEVAINQEFNLDTSSTSHIPEIDGITKKKIDKCKGITTFYENGIKSKEIFESPHVRNGQIVKYKDGVVEEKKYLDLETIKFKNGEKIEQKYIQPHKYKGQIIKYEHGLKKEWIFKHPHVRNGEIQKYKYGVLAEIKFIHPHEYEGQTIKFMFGTITEKIHESPHFRNGEIVKYKCGEKIEEKYIHPHKDKGQIIKYEHGLKKEMIFEIPHELAGLIVFFKNGNPIRKKFIYPHKDRGLTIELINTAEDDILTSLKFNYESPHIEQGKRAICTCKRRLDSEEYVKPHPLAGTKKKFKLNDSEVSEIILNGKKLYP